MKPTKRIEDFLKVKSNELYFAVFAGELKQTIYVGIAGQLGSSLLPEEVAFLDWHIQQVGGGIAKMMKDLRVGIGVFIRKAGPHEGQPGVIIEILGPPQSRDKTQIKYKVEVDGQFFEYLAYEIERKKLPRGLNGPSIKRPGPPLGPINFPKI